MGCRGGGSRGAGAGVFPHVFIEIGVVLFADFGGGIVVKEWQESVSFAACYPRYGMQQRAGEDHGAAGDSGPAVVDHEVVESNSGALERAVGMVLDRITQRDHHAHVPILLKKYLGSVLSPGSKNKTNNCQPYQIEATSYPCELIWSE